VQRAIRLRGDYAEMEFAAALITCVRRKANHCDRGDTAIETIAEFFQRNLWKNRSFDLAVISRASS